MEDQSTFQVELKNLTLKMVEKVTFKAKDTNEEITYYSLTFVDSLNFAKIVLNSSKPFDQFDNKIVNVIARLEYKEWQGKANIKVKVVDLVPVKP